MPELDNRPEEQVSSASPKKKSIWIAAVALVGILIAIILINLNEIQNPFDSLNAIIAPVVVGLVLAYFLNFFLRFFEYKLRNKIKHRKVNRAISMLLSYIFMLVIIAGILLLIIPSLVENIQDLPQMRAKADVFVAQTQGAILRLFGKINMEVPIEFSEYLTSPDSLYKKVGELVASFVATSGDKLVSGVITVGATTVTVLKNIIIGIFISIYVLLSKERLNAGCRRVFRALLPEVAEKKVLYYVGEAHSKIGGYLVGKAIDSLMVMLVCMLLFSIFKIPFAMLIAVIIGITDFIPFFGPFIGAIPSGVIIFFIDPPKVIVFALLILVVQQIDGNLIAPIILGNKTGLTSLGVIIAITVMGGMFGIFGMLIGVPIFALVITILDDFIKSRLAKKGEATDLNQYYPADAFIRPHDSKQNDETLTKRFVRWVSSVETEVAGVDYKPSRRHTFGRGIRRFFFAIGSFFHRLFSVKPILEDQSSGIFLDIAKKGMRNDRRFWRVALASIFTLFLYPFYLIEYMAQSTNIACRTDGKRTWGALPFLVFSIITLGIFPLVWHCKIITRFENYCHANGQKCSVSRKFYLLWTLVGFLIVVGPLIALARVLRGYNQMCSIYNSLHHFPLSDEEIREEQQRIADEVLSRKERKKRIQRRSLLEDIIAPHEEDIIEAEAFADDAASETDEAICDEQLSIDELPLPLQSTEE